MTKYKSIIALLCALAILSAFTSCAPHSHEERIMEQKATENSNGTSESSQTESEDNGNGKTAAQKGAAFQEFRQVFEHVAVLGSGYAEDILRSYLKTEGYDLQDIENAEFIEERNISRPESIGDTLKAEFKNASITYKLSEGGKEEKIEFSGTLSTTYSENRKTFKSQDVVINGKEYSDITCTLTYDGDVISEVVATLGHDKVADEAELLNFFAELDGE